MTGVLLATCLILAAHSALAAPPTFESIYPAGAAVGSTNAVVLKGTFDPWPPQIWCDEPGLSFQTDTNKSKVQIQVNADAKPGPRLVRLYNSEGASDPRIFVVGIGPEIAEVEPNNLFAKAQLLESIPVTINGKLDKRGDVDSFAITLKAGDWLDAAVDSYTLMSKLDPVLRLVNTNGVQLAWNHDYSTLDPRLFWQAPAAMQVVIQIFGFPYPADSEVNFTGGDAAVYRLHVRKTRNLPCEFEESASEQEPNDTVETAQRIELPFETVGTVEWSGDEDYFEFSMAGDGWIQARAVAEDIGSPLDPRIKIFDGKGNLLATNDDADSSRDARLDWKAPASGKFFLAVGSLVHRGGPSFKYHLEILKEHADCAPTLAAAGVVLEPGGTNDLAITLKKLFGFTNQLAAFAKGLPPSVMVTNVLNDAKKNELTLRFLAATNAESFSGPIQVALRELPSGNERVVPMELTSRSENNGVPGGYRRLLAEKLETVWLTVKPKALPAEKKPDKQ